MPRKSVVAPFPEKKGSPSGKDWEKKVGPVPFPKARLGGHLCFINTQMQLHEGERWYQQLSGITLSMAPPVGKLFLKNGL